MYKLSNAANIVINVSDESSFDITSGHPFALEYIKWLDSGNTPMPADIISTIPTQVSMSQARLALIQNNLLTAVNAAVSQAGIEAQTFWEYSSTVEINNPLVLAIKMQLNWTDDQLNALFILANSL